MTHPETSQNPLSSKERLELALEPTNSNMGLEDYLQFGYLRLDDLKGMVLDLGSGDLDRFSREAAVYGITVVSINPFLSAGIERDQVINGSHFEFPWSSQIPWQGRSIAAITQELPLRDGSIDTIVSSAAIPGYIDPADYIDTLSEIKRVLAPGGKAFLFPLVEVPGAPYDHEKFMAALDQSGMTYVRKRIPEELSAIPHSYEIVELVKDQ